MGLRARGLLLLLAWGLLAVGPCGPMPGGRLDGPVVTGPVDDWSFVDDFERCQLELRPANPHSINVSCYQDAGQLYVGALWAERKRWPSMAEGDPRVRIRVGGRVYEGLAQAVEAGDALDRVFRARARKYEAAEPAPGLRAPEGYRAWRLLPRPG